MFKLLDLIKSKEVITTYMLSVSLGKKTNPQPFQKHLDNLLNCELDITKKIKVDLLYLAVEYQNKDVVIALVNKGVDPNTPKNHKSDNLPLHWAVLMQNHEIIKALVDCKGINLNALGKKGETPLDIAIRLDDKVTQQYLLEKLSPLTRAYYDLTALCENISSVIQSVITLLKQLVGLEDLTLQTQQQYKYCQSQKPKPLNASGSNHRKKTVIFSDRVMIDSPLRTKKERMHTLPSSKP